MFLRVETNDKGRNVNDLLPNTDESSGQMRWQEIVQNSPDVSLVDEYTSVVDALGQTALEDLSLESSFQEILDLESKHVIQSHTAFVEHANSYKSTDEGVTLEQTLGILGIELQQFSSSTTNFGQNQGDTPDFTLVAQAVFTCKLTNTISWTGRQIKELTLSSASRRADSKGRRGTL